MYIKDMWCVTMNLGGSCISYHVQAKTEAAAKRKAMKNLLRPPFTIIAYHFDSYYVY